MLRQQEAMPSGQPNRSLADFVAPTSSGVADYIGAFAVTGGLGADELVKRYEKQHDDYRAIMVKALADRLAEAFAEYLHARVRREWGYGATEVLTHDDLIAEKYRGIRPAFGYPGVPGSYGEDQAVRSAGGRARRHQADRELRDDAGGQRQRPVPEPSAGALLHARAASDATSSKTMRRESDRRLMTSRGGSQSTWTSVRR